MLHNTLLKRSFISNINVVDFALLKSHNLHITHVSYRNNSVAMNEYDTATTH